MKDILDFIILIMFVIMVASFIINFNKQQIEKFKEKLNKTDKTNGENIDE